MSVDDDMIARLREARQRANVGPWTTDDTDVLEGFGAAIGEFFEPEDCQFVALAANHIDALLDVCEAARAAALERGIARFRDHGLPLVVICTLNGAVAEGAIVGVLVDDINELLGEEATDGA